MSKITKIMKSSKPLRKPQKLDTNSDSLSSLFTTWQQNESPPFYAIETGNIVSPAEFYLFFTAIILLAVASGLIAMSFWSIFFKLPLTLLIDTSTELASFTLPGAILCLPCFWIVLSVHNDPKSYRFLSLVLLLLTFSIVFMIIAIYLGFTHKLRSVDDATLKESEFRQALLAAVKMYEENRTVRKAWDKIQTTWFCCGVDKFSDWPGTSFPKSCCNNTGVACRGDNLMSSRGCLKIIIAVLALQTRLFNGINCVALFIMSCTLITLAGVYFSRKRLPQE